MGASDWAYFVPYQTDLESALQALRQNVFANGEYYKPADWFRRLHEDNIIDQQRLTTLLESVSSTPEPQTIEELIQMRGLDGTHSIIDITRVSTELDYGVVTPLSEQEYSDVFGTDTPTHEMVEQKADHLVTMRERWQGVYVLVYEGDVPNEIFFAGFSGD